MSLNRKRLVLGVAVLGGAALALLAMTPLLLRSMSPVTASLIEGLAAAVCLAGVGYGIWDARRLETRRKAKEDIWIKH